MGTRERRYMGRVALLGLAIGVLLIICIAILATRAGSQAAAVRRIRSLGGSVQYDFETTFVPEYNSFAETANPPPGPAWLRKLLGDDVFVNSFSSVVTVTLGARPISDSAMARVGQLKRLQAILLVDAKVTSAGIAQLARLHDLRGLNLKKSTVTDDALAYLAGLDRIEAIGLDETQVTDAGIRHLKGLAALEELTLAGTQVTGAGLRHLGHLTSLTKLDLSGTRVDDTGLKQVTGLTNLTELNLSATTVTDRGLQHLKSLASLRLLYLFSCPHVSNTAVEQLRLAAPGLIVAR